MNYDRIFPVPVVGTPTSPYSTPGGDRPAGWAGTGMGPDGTLAQRWQDCC